MAAPTTLPVALITGTNSGVGLALAVKMAANHRVFAGIRGVTADKRAALDAAAAAHSVSENITVVDLDVCSDASVAAAVGQMFEATDGRCDILVNNAGYAAVGSVELVEMDEALRQYDTNVFGVIRCQKAVLPSMRKRRSGKIVNVSSVGGVWGQPFNDLYCGSKFALEGMSEAQAPVFRSFGVRVSCVQPGAISTAFKDNVKLPDFANLPEEYAKPLQSTMAAYQHTGAGAQTAEEVAQVVVDQVITVDDPPLKVQTSEVIMPIVRGQLVDPTGEWGVQAAGERFLAGL